MPWILLLCLLMTSPAWADTRYVDQNCGDVSTYVPKTRACTGGTATTRNTIIKGLALTQARDTLLIRGGTYPESPRTDTHVFHFGSSLSDAPIIAGMAGETVIIHGRVNFEFSTDRWMIWKNLIFDGQRTNPAEGIYIAGHDLVFEEITTRNFLSSGIYCATTGHSHRVSKLHTHNNGHGTVHHGLYWTCNDSTLEEIDAHDNAALGIQIQNADPGLGSNRNVLRNSKFYNNPQQGIVIDGEDNEVYNNLVYNNGAGIHLYPVGGSPPKSHRNLIYNNTIYGNQGEGLAIGLSPQHLTTDNTFHNNIVLDNTPNIQLNPGQSGSDFSHNLCNSVGTGCELAGTAEQTFVKAPDADFRLTANSPAKDAGVSLTGMTRAVAGIRTDFGGIARPQGPHIDIGAHERVQETPAEADSVTLLSHWTFDAGSGTTAINSVAGGPALTLSESDWVPGIIGPFAFAPDGVSVASLPNATALDEPDSLSASMWLRLPSISANGCTPLTRHNAWGFYIYGDGTPSAFIHDGSTFVEAKTTRTLSATKTHLGLTYDRNGVNPALRLYMNGVQVAMTSYSGAINFSGGQSLTVGKGPNTTFPCTGVTDQVYLYRGQVSATGMANLFNEGASVPAEADSVTLLSHWTFDAGSGTTAINSVAGGPALTLSESDWVPGIIGPFAFAPDGVSVASLPNATALDEPDSLSASMWLRLPSISANGCTPLTRHNAWGFYIYGDGTPSAFIHDGSTFVEAKTTRTLSATKTHLGLTYDRNGVNPALRLYMNGVQVAMTSYSGAINFSGGQSLTVGKGPNTTFPCTGVTDQVYLYRGQVSATGMANLFNEGASVP